MTPTEKIMKWIAVVSLLLGAACIVSFKFIGGTLDDAGIIHEPFILVILGWFLIALSVVSLIVCYLVRGWQRYKK